MDKYHTLIVEHFLYKRQLSFPPLFYCYSFMVLLQEVRASSSKKMQMRSVPSYFSKQIGFPQRYGIDPVNSKNFFKPKSTAEAKVLAAKKHSESEKRRRTRINNQYAALRKILPNLIKMDKASVLAETVRQVRDLKKVVGEIGAACRGSGSGSDECVIPSVVNKLSLEKCVGKQEGLVKATFSCEDRPGLISDMTRELRSVKGRVVRAEMVTVGGRTKIVLRVKGLDAGSEGMVWLKKALNKVVTDRPRIIQKLHLPQ